MAYTMISDIQDLVPVCPNCHAMLHRKVNDINYSRIKRKAKMKVLAIYYDIKTLFLLPYRAVPYLQCDIYIVPFAFDVVGIEHFDISTF